MNRIGKSPVLVTSSNAATMVATTSRIHYHQRRADSEEGDVSEPLPSPSAPLPLQEYDDDFSANTVNNATLPYFRNSHKVASSIISAADENNSISNLNFPKSVSSWGPLHKPMHWKVRFVDALSHACLRAALASFTCHLVSTSPELTVQWRSENTRSFTYCFCS